ncbi:hypothetical protein FO519_010819, partial [Halicephalobus sp. NKZ332]
MVAELRDQLSVRGLDTKGVKNILVQRLQKALDDERAAEESGNAGDNNQPVQEQHGRAVGDDEAAPDDPMDTSAQDKRDEIPEDPQNDTG